MKGNLDHQLRLFVEIANGKSLSAAAEALSLTQSGLSRQLASLEDYIGQPLFVRVVARFMAQRPNANVALLGRSSPGVVELVEAGRAEIGFVYDSAVASDALEITPLFEEQMCFVVHESSRFATQAAVSLNEDTPPLVVFPASYALRRMLHTRTFDATVAAEVETVDAMLKLVSLTNGQCVLPSLIPKKLLSEYQLVSIPIEEPLMQRRIVAITRRGRPLSAMTALVLQIALESAAKT
jgi:DNA-binding transcriptional LysR family regulator